eukprot:Gregarina_sp_Pseudo_9__1907@NODE_2309_length_1046_cov_91_193644_g2126_i0_p1_GENE_NODE_2309_length_1046_cov_91_193644_g2126_i0NODE_2309_length_1046_cov_91_193644_g2126_i0_p1_ORF_typecomplete_len212_score34_09AAA_13/PF13166_6/0_00022DUF2353/PF09789_9/0_00068Tht1/PF04163_12/0_00073MT/PF12777_7/0_0012KASH_CCD/PF14662_6/0_0022MAD/PF05557_13/0_0028UPF0242/PF06785_11/0_0043TACC_C/PF05010_14/0_0048Laminin_II/PF06009_12/0_0063DUF3584/PF12128_8/0_0054DUF4201/PF13870_6/0_0082DUF4201/PF13870_6/5_6e02Myosin_
MVADLASFCASLRLPNKNQDLAVLYNKVLNDYKDRVRSCDTRSSKLNRENAEMQLTLLKTHEAIQETKAHIDQHSKLVRQMKSQRDDMTSQLSNLRREFSTISRDLNTYRLHEEVSSEEQTRLMDLFHKVLGVRLLTHDDGKKCIVIDRILPQREDLSCSIICVNHGEKIALIPKKIEPKMPGLLRFLSTWGSDDLHMAALACRLLYKANT